MMKRSRPLTFDDESHGISPPQKKTKNCISAGTQQEKQIVVCVTTKLGTSQKEFSVSDLRTLEWFQNFMITDQVTIKNETLSFGVTEIQELIALKTSNAISRGYPPHRLLYLVEASDYFATPMAEVKLSDFMNNYVLHITQTQLAALRTQCADSMTESKKILQAIIEQRQKNESDFLAHQNHSLIMKWKSINGYLMTSNEHVAAKIFADNFKLVHKPSEWDADGDEMTKPEVLYIELFKNIKSEKDALTLWKFLYTNQSWKRYKRIGEAINKTLGKDLDISDRLDCIDGPFTMNTRRTTAFVDVFVDVFYLACVGELVFESPLDHVMYDVCPCLPPALILRFVQGLQAKLIESDREASTKVVTALCESLTVWFEACVPTMKEWMFTEFVEMLSRQSVERLLESVCSYIIDSCYEPTDVSIVCIEFANKYGNLSWNISSKEQNDEKQD